MEAEMKLSRILAAASILAAPGLAVAQVHGVGGVAGVAAHGVGGMPGLTGRGASLPGTAGVHAGAARIGFHGGRFDHHPGFHDRFRHRDDVAAIYPYWGWSDCAFDVDCGWGGPDPAGMTPADYADPPGQPPGYDPAPAPPRRAEVNECSDWVWNARLHRSVCKRPFRG
jgi:hypothetical protein